MAGLDYVASDGSFSAANGLSSTSDTVGVIMVNSGISTDERRDVQHRGWQGCLDELERAVAAPEDEG